jgi:lambda repressor-like predicted transcriptional regulator
MEGNKRGRRSSIDPKKLTELAKRHTEGESLSSISRSTGIPLTTLHRALSEKTAQLTNVSRNIAKVNREIDLLPYPDRALAIDLAGELRVTSDNLAAAGRLGAQTAHRLMALANEQAAKLDDVDPVGEDGNNLKAVIALIRTANDAAQTGLNLMKVGADSLPTAPDVAAKKIKTLNDFYANNN